MKEMVAKIRTSSAQLHIDLNTVLITYIYAKFTHWELWELQG